MKRIGFEGYDCPHAAVTVPKRRAVTAARDKREATSRQRSVIIVGCVDDAPRTVRYQRTLRSGVASFIQTRFRREGRLELHLERGDRRAEREEVAREQREIGDLPV